MFAITDDQDSEMSSQGKRKSFAFEDIPDLLSQEGNAEAAVEKVMRLDACPSDTPLAGGEQEKGAGTSNLKPTKSNDVYDFDTDDNSESSRGRAISQTSCTSTRSQSTASSCSQELDVNWNSAPSTPGPSRVGSASGRGTPGQSRLTQGMSIGLYAKDDDDSDGEVDDDANDVMNVAEDDATDSVDDIQKIMREIQDGVGDITDGGGDLLAATQAAPALTDQRSLLGRGDAEPDPNEEEVAGVLDYSDAELEADEDDDLEEGTKQKLIRGMVALDVVPG